jgi:hypothetical protein
MFESPEPMTISDINGPVVREIRKLWEPLGWEPWLPTDDQKADHLAAGHRLAFLPGSRREIQYRNHVLLLRRRNGSE